MPSTALAPSPRSISSLRACPCGMRAIFLRLFTPPLPTADCRVPCLMPGFVTARFPPSSGSHWAGSGARASEKWAT